MKDRSRHARVLCVACCILGLGLAQTGLWGQTAYLVTDLTPGEIGDSGLELVSFLPAGGHMFFSTNADQPEVWVTDGTPAQTQRLPLPTDPACGACEFGFIAAAGDLGYYTYAGQLWRSDGTRSGTFLLPVAVGTLFPSPFAVLQGILYFITFDSLPPGPSSTVSEQLWRTDGTAAGTSMVADLGPGLYGSQQELVVAGGRLFFLAPGSTPPGSTVDLWVSDGTAHGTIRLTSFQEQLPSRLTAAGSQVFFFAGRGGAATQPLWVSNGTAAGTRLVMQSSATAWLAVAGTRVDFEAPDAAQQTQIWTSDGTLSGTRQVTAAAAGFTFPASAAQVVEAGGKLLFVAAGSLWSVALGQAAAPADLCSPGLCGVFDPRTQLYLLGSRAVFATGRVDLGFAYWASDGTVAGTLKLQVSCSSDCLSPPEATLLGGHLYFPVTESSSLGIDSQLWRTDGTLAGTRRFTSRLILRASPLVSALRNKVFFAAIENGDDNPPQSELFVSAADGTGARQLTDVPSPNSSMPSNLIAGAGALFFTTFTGAPSLWSSDGTAPGTLPVPVPRRFFFDFTPRLAPGLGGVLFVGSSGSAPSQLWRSDGTPAGTLQLTDLAPTLMIQAQPVAADTQAYFAVADVSGRGSIWRTDGSPQGTVEAFALPPALTAVDEIAVVGHDLYLESGGGGGAGLWKSDGTTAGTVQLASFPFTPSFSSFVVFGSKVYFVANEDLNGGPQHLWQTDGTPAGTLPVHPAGGLLGDPKELAPFGGALYLLAHVGGADLGLWRLDGTGAATELRSFPGNQPGVVASYGGPVQLGDVLAFYAVDGVHGSELWTTDGTVSGTRLVKDILPGSIGSLPRNLTVAGGKLFFSADDGVHGRELWESDGTEAGTRMVQDINPGPASANPFGMTAVGDRLFFAADDGITGQQLWALPLGGAGGCQPDPTALCLAGGRFKVEALWRDAQGNSGFGQALPLTGDTGAFWFFGPDNLEVVVKVLDGRALDGHFWVFYGALSDVEYSLTVTDTVTGLTRRYFNPLGTLASVGDTMAFGPHGASSTGTPQEGAARPRPARGVTPAAAHVPPASLSLPRSAAATAPASPLPAASAACQAGPQRLCLDGGRFAVQATWTDFNGNHGTGKAVDLTDETGYLWFFSAGNVEVLLKVIDGRAVNGHFWVFFGALSNVQYTLTVTDTATGTMRTYTNPAGQFASVADTSAF